MLANPFRAGAIAAAISLVFTVSGIWTSSAAFAQEDQAGGEDLQEAVREQIGAVLPDENFRNDPRRGRARTQLYSAYNPVSSPPNYLPNAFRYGAYCGPGIPAQFTLAQIEGEGHPLYLAPEESRWKRVRSGVANTFRAGWKMTRQGVGSFGNRFRRGGNDEGQPAPEDSLAEAQPPEDAQPAEEARELRVRDERSAVHAARVAHLRQVGPPVDEIDALCFAHDYCYEVVGHDSVECDYAFTKALAEKVSEFDYAGLPQCANAAALMFVAFLNKPSMESDFGRIVRTGQILTLYDGSTGELRELVNARLNRIGAAVPLQPGQCGSADMGQLTALGARFSSHAQYATEALQRTIEEEDPVGRIIAESELLGEMTNPAIQAALNAGMQQAAQDLTASLLGVEKPFEVCMAFSGAGETTEASCDDAALMEAFGARRQYVAVLMQLLDGALAARKLLGLATGESFSFQSFRDSIVQRVLEEQEEDEAEAAAVDEAMGTTPSQ